jgi:VWFA-related protein
VGSRLRPAGGAVSTSARLLLAAALVAPLGARTALSQAPPEPHFLDHVEVDVVVVDARVVDGRGRPIPGLKEGDFRVKVDGHVVPLQSVTWVAEGTPADPAVASAALAAGLPEPPPGRLVVLFFQKDFEPSRALGFLQMLRRASEMLDTLAPEDRVAVVSFDTRLNLWTDFTNDRARLRRVLDRSILSGHVPTLEAGTGPSLAGRFDPAAGRRVATPETALLRLGEALEDLPGNKSLVLFGWGMGRWSPGAGVFLEADYGPARQVLVRGHVTVFALDITNADYHTLEVGLEQVAEDTGGFYAKTHLFPGQAFERLQHALAGHYVLTFPRPDLPRGEHSIDIDLVGHKGQVLARPTYQG